jgi:hypothetical protein
MRPLFDDGVVRDLQYAPGEARGSMLLPLADPAYFAQVRVDEEAQEGTAFGRGSSDLLACHTRATPCHLFGPVFGPYHRVSGRVGPCRPMSHMSRRSRALVAIAVGDDARREQSGEHVAPLFATRSWPTPAGSSQDNESTEAVSTAV